MNSPTTRAFYTVADLAALLDVSKMTIYRWVDDHPDDVVTVRRSIRIKGTAVQRLLDGK